MLFYKISLIICIALLADESVSFNAHLTRPWVFKRGHLRIRTRGNKPKSQKHVSSTSLLPQQAKSEQSALSLSSASDSGTGSSSSSSSTEDETASTQESSSQHDIFLSTRMTPPLLESNVTSSIHDSSTTGRLNGKQYGIKSTVWNQLGPLTRMTRPQNFPGIFLFHLIGIYTSLQSVGRMDVFWKILLASPAMWLVLSSVVLVSCTSMVVNDYFDAKLGRDKNTDRPLVTGDISFQVVRRYVSYLYAAALVCCTLLPGSPARLSVILALMLTYWYTNHLKPLTWVKNAVCAFLIAFAPLTSGSAALHLVAKETQKGFLPVLMSMAPLWRVVAMLFFGILGREMTMDCNDVENDRAVGVRTIPVVHGPVLTSRVAMACATVAAGLAIVGPVSQIGIVPRAIWGRRLGLATTASIVQLTGAWRVWRTEGRNRKVVSSAVDVGAMTILLFLASYL